MPLKPKTRKQQEHEIQLKNLSNVFQRRGIIVRREKLSRGHSFRVKSGDCLFSGDNLVFVDRRLPLEQQVSVLVDYLVDFDFELEQQERDSFSAQTKALLNSRSAAVSS